MEDLFGGTDAVQEFWRSPDSERGRRPTEVKGKWIIPLSKCK